MRTKIILTVCLAITSVAFSCAQSLSLEPGVEWSVESVRTWESFDGKVPGDDPYQKWKSNTAISYESHRYTPDQRVPEGKFAEFLVWFDATGADSVAVDLVQAGVNTLEASLLYGEGRRSGVKGFVIPGTSAAASRSLIETWEGNLHFGLAPGERTWILLLFDIPVEVTEAKLQLKSAGSLPVTVPAGG